MHLVSACLPFLLALLHQVQVVLGCKHQRELALTRTHTPRMSSPFDPSQDAKKVLEEKFKTGKNRWFFTKLRF